MCEKISLNIQEWVDMIEVRNQNREAKKGTQGRRDSAENSKLIKKKLGDQSKRANNELTVGLAQRTEIQEEKII